MTKYPKWYQKAEKEIGVLEKPGEGDNPRVIEYHASTSLKATHDSVPWCASFVSWVLEQSGVHSTRSAWARSYLRWGVRLKTPVPGCVVILERGAKSGHVGFLESYDAKKDRVMLLGGNQADQVCLRTFPAARVLGYQWPHDEPIPEGVATLKALKPHE